MMSCVGEAGCSRQSESMYKGAEMCFGVMGGRGSGEAGKAEAGVGEPQLFIFIFFLLMQGYDQGLEPCAGKMTSRAPLGTSGERSQLGERVPFTRINHYLLHLQKRTANSTRKGDISQYSFMFLGL